MEMSTVIVAGVMAASNLGGVGLLLGWYMRRVDANSAQTEKHDVMLAKASENMDNTAATLAKVQKGFDELLAGWHAHEKELAMIETFHVTKGCKQYPQFRGRRHENG